MKKIEMEKLGGEAEKIAIVKQLSQSMGDPIDLSV